MKHKKIALFTAVVCLFAVMAALLLNSNTLFASGANTDQNNQATKLQNDASTDEARQAVQRVATLIEARNLNGLEILAEEVEAKSETLEKADYGNIMLKIISALDTYDFKDKKQYLLARRYAKTALEKADQMPAATEVEIVLHLQGRSEYSSGLLKNEDWVQDRTERMKYWFHAWQRLEREIERNFDFDKRPLLNIQPPARGLPVGVAPQLIKDPKLRTEYEAAIQENKKKIEVYNKQWALRNVDKDFSKYSSSFVIDAYLTAPYNWVELKQYLDVYVSDETTKNRILNEVSQGMVIE